MIVNPGIRRFLGSAIQRLFNSASFYAPLTHSAIPVRAASGTTATFTRATEGRVKDNEGVLRTAIAGEARFEGARRVRNLISTTSEDFSNAAWTRSNTTITANQTTSPDGALTADLFYPTTTGTFRSISQTILGVSIAGSTVLSVSVYAKPAGMSWLYLGLPGTGSNQGAYFNLSTGAIGTIKAGAANVTMTAVGNGWYRCSLTQLDTVDTGAYPLISIADADNSTTATTNGTDGVYIWGAQLEDVTGRADQTTPSEYVSVGVVQRNVLLQTENFAATWVAVGSPTLSANALSSGGVSLSLVGDDDVGSTEGYYQSVTFTGDGTKTVSIHVKEGTSAPAAGTRFYLYDNTAGANRAFGTITWVAGVPSVAMLDGTLQSSTLISNGVYRIAFTAPSVVAANANRLYLIVSGTAAQTGNIYAGGAQAENSATLTDYQAVGGSYLYHGAGVDGVKCFNTDLSGNLIPAATNTGYVAEGARTNLAIRSQEKASWALATATLVDGSAVAPDGTTTGILCYPDSTGTTRGFYHDGVTGGVDAVNTNHCFSFYAKPAGMSWVYMYDFVGAALAASWNVTTGVVGTVAAGYTASIEPAAFGWYRCKLVKTAASAVTYTQLGVADADNSAAVTKSGTNGAYFWGMGLEAAAFVSSYIATTTVAVTRNADVESYSTSGNIAAAAGSVYLEYTPTHAPSGTVAFWGTYVDADNYTAILHDATNLIFRKRIAGSNYDATIANAFVSGTTYKVAATWGAAGTAIYLDGVAGTPHANTTAAQIAATMQVGADGNSLQQPGAGTTNLRIWQRQLSISEGVAVTA